MHINLDFIKPYLKYLFADAGFTFLLCFMFGAGIVAWIHSGYFLAFVVPVTIALGVTLHRTWEYFTKHKK